MIALAVPVVGLGGLLLGSNFGLLGLGVGAAAAVTGTVFVYRVRKKRAARRSSGESGKDSDGLMPRRRRFGRRRHEGAGGQPGGLTGLGGRSRRRSRGSSPSGSVGGLLGTDGRRGKRRGLLGSGPKGVVAGRRTPPGARTAAEALGRSGGSGGVLSRRRRASGAHRGGSGPIGTGGPHGANGRRRRGTWGGGHGGQRSPRGSSSWWTKSDRPRKPRVRAPRGPRPLLSSDRTPGSLRWNPKIGWHWVPRRGLGYFAMWTGLLGGGYALVPMVAPTALGITGLIGTGIGYAAAGLGGVWVLRHPRVRYGARVLAGWAWGAVSWLWRWAWRQYRDETSRPAVVARKVPWWRPSWTPPRGGAAVPTPPRRPPAPPPPPVVITSARPAGPGRAPALHPSPKTVTSEVRPITGGRPRRQPALTSAAAHSVTSTTTTTKRIRISMSMQHIVEAIVNGDSFVPQKPAGPDTEEHLNGYVAVLQALAAKFGGDMANITATLPQFTDALQNLSHFGDALSGMAAQAAQEIQTWSDASSFVWK
jgi:hypothetical protein